MKNILDLLMNDDRLLITSIKQPVIMKARDIGWDGAAHYNGYIHVEEENQIYLS